jgi:hypothetical protein
MTSITGESADPNMAGVVGKNTVNGVGIWGEANPEGRAIVGVAQGGAGVWGHTVTGRGVVGVSDTGVGVWGANKSGRAVVGAVDGEGTGVWGEAAAGRAVVGVINGAGTGLWGEVTSGTGVVGVTNDANGVGAAGNNESGDGVRGTGHVGVSGFGSQFGIYARSDDTAGMFEGKVVVTRDLILGGDLVLQNADCAEDFDLDHGTTAEPGAVMVLTRDGAVRPCTEAFDTRVAGVVSGAGRYRPAIVLDRTAADRRLPLALMGKVYCQVDASDSPIEIGDLLTTSGTVGHAMKVTDRTRALGCVLGKALGPLPSGRGLIPILVALQ